MEELEHDDHYDEDDHDHHGHHHNFGELYGGLPQNDWATIHLLALLVITISLTGSFYVIRQSVKWRKMMVNTTQRIPLFIALSDATFGLLHGMDHLISFSTGYVNSGALCVFFGSGSIFAMNATAIWVTAASFYFWKMVVYNCVVDLGKYDWKLFVLAWGVPLVWSLVPHITHEYGPEMTWCGTKNRHFLWNGPIVLICLFSSAFFYGSLAWFLHQHRRMMKQVIGNVSSERKDNSVAILTAGRSDPKLLEENKPKKSENRLDKLVRELPVLSLVSIVQWAPYIAYLWTKFFGKDAYALDISVALFTNARGIANAFAFRHMNMTGKAGREAATATSSFGRTRVSNTSPYESASFFKKFSFIRHISGVR